MRWNDIGFDSGSWKPLRQKASTGRMSCVAAFWSGKFERDGRWVKCVDAD
jgi:hypothetical protein